MARGGGFLFFLELIAPGLADRTRTTMIRGIHQQPRYVLWTKKRLTLGVDGARDTVGETDIELGEGVLGVDRGLRKVSDGSSLDHVLHGETLDSLVLLSIISLAPGLCLLLPIFPSSHLIPFFHPPLAKPIIQSFPSCSPTRHSSLPIACRGFKPLKPTLGTHREQLEHLTNLT